jgi:hypothetical protein
MKTCYQISKPRGRTESSAPALTQTMKGSNPMDQANRVHSTPQLNAPVDPTRRSFLSTAAGVATGGAVLAMATIPPASAAAGPAGSLDPAGGDPEEACEDEG